MRARLTTRLEKLEADRGARGGGLPVAVVQSPFPAGDPQEWALSILEEVGGCAGVWVVEGSERSVLLPPTDAHGEQSMPNDGEAERLWLDAGRTYPHILICGDGKGGMLVERFESEDHERQRVREMEAEGVGV